MPDPLSLNGITLSGNSIGCSILGLRASGLATGIFIKGACEGTKIFDADIVGVDNGIVSWPDTGGGEPGLWISNVHINATQWGIHLRNRYEVFLSDLLIYAADYFQTTKGFPFYSVVLENCNEVSLTEVLYSSVAPPEKPIVPFTKTNCGPNIFGEPRRIVLT